VGCDGGQLNDALQYVLEHGIPKENDYGPYLGVVSVVDKAILLICLRR
jgi:hypothetical protein